MTTETPPPPAGREWPPSDTPEDPVPPPTHGPAGPPAPAPGRAPTIGSPMRFYALVAIVGAGIAAVVAVLVR